MALNRLKQLAAHEVGHTLGLMHNYASSANNRASVMDYPPPQVTLDANGEIDLADAYANGIGAWDKVSITWGYADLSAEKNAAAIQNTWLSQASLKNGLQFISDRDARAAGGIHPQAHLWDNGTDAVASLQNAMKVRSVALAHFGEKNIRSGMPMAMLEDILVPTYLFHRYQLEAVTKIIGGMYYTYALRGDGQVVTRTLTREEQLRALHAVIDCIDPNVLMLPEKVIALIPPRPAGYGFTRELFKKRTGLAFDALAPAESATDLPFSFLFNSERVSRLVEHEPNGGLSLSDMLGLLIDSTWKAPRRAGMQKLIQLQTEQILLTYLLALSVDDNANFVARAAGVKAVSDLKIYLTEQQKAVTDYRYASHIALALERMKTPEKAKPTTMHLDAPPGAPIGCDEIDQY